MEERLTKKQIGELIPHRDPFLFLDELINIKKLDVATGIKTFNNNEQFFQGHFPDHPIVPGVILIEMMAQAGAALIAYSISEDTKDKIVYLMNIEKSKFRNPVFPDQKIFTDVKALRSKGRVWKLEGKTYDTENKSICEATWSAMIMDKNNV
jgi:3-hydroxyacyl-[acyl-carrier-protein] dehydratase